MVIHYHRTLDSTLLPGLDAGRQLGSDGRLGDWEPSTRLAGARTLAHGSLGSQTGRETRGKTLEKPWENHGKPWKKTWKTMKKKHGKTMEKPWKNHGTHVYCWDMAVCLMGNLWFKAMVREQFDDRFSGWNLWEAARLSGKLPRFIQQGTQLSSLDLKEIETFGISDMAAVQHAQPTSILMFTIP